MASKNLRLRDLFSESGKIFKAHSRHFLTLTLIFLFPLSSLFLFLLPLNFNHSFTKPFSTTNHQPFFHLLYSLFLSILSYSGVISITYSVFHFFYDQPVNLLSAINSISTSFLPLLATTIVSHVIFFFISLFYGLLLLLLISGATLFGVTIPHSFPPYLIAFFVSLPLLLVLVHLQVKWTLVHVIVVVESCWGLEPLRRSARLIKGMKRVALSSFLYYGFFAGIIVGNYLLFTISNRDNDNWVNVVVFNASQSCFLSQFMLSNIAVNTVLYIYCKANHGELAEEFEKDSVSLLLADGKLSNIAV